MVRSAGSVRASLVTYITPVVGVFLGWAVLGEGIGLHMIVGGALIASGVAGVMYGRRFPLAGLNLARLGFGRARGGEAEAGAPARTFT
jgi:drug/metabolite transporter (DMT)-like permease